MTTSRTMRPERQPEQTDPLAEYVATVPLNLRGDQWGRWRATHPPPHLRPGARRGGRCAICGNELGALDFCHACHRREFELLQARPAAPRPARKVVGVDGRKIREEWREYAAEGRYRPAGRKLWYVVLDRDDAEVTRSLHRDVAELFL